jgi:hypothetical protein
LAALPTEGPWESEAASLAQASEEVRAGLIDLEDALPRERQLFYRQIGLRGRVTNDPETGLRMGKHR